MSAKFLFITVNPKSEAKKTTNDEGKSLGVLYTGYLEKRNPMTGSYKKRFVVLTHDSIHWFKRAEGYDLFGEERGHVQLSSIVTTRILDEDGSIFEIQGTDARKRLFRAASCADCEEWVSAIRSATKSFSSQQNKNKAQSAMVKRSSISGIKNLVDDDNFGENYEKREVKVLLVSLKSQSNQQSEVVIARNPEWGRIIFIPQIKEGNEIIISLTNGGIVTLTSTTLYSKSEDGLDFDQPVQSVTLASSLRMSILQDAILSEGSGKAMTSQGGSGGSAQKSSILKQPLEVLIMLTRDRTYSINLVLSMMVFIVGLASVRTLGTNASLLYLFAVLLATYNLNQIVMMVKGSIQQQAVRGKAIRLILHGHTFTSPDAPIIEPDNEIPQRFIDGCEGDMKEARRRWDITRHWRETEGINKILEEPQPYFQIIKQMYPHYHRGRGKSGYVVFYERPGDFECSQLVARGIKTEDQIRHWLFTTEYQWQVMCNGDETAKGISVIDAGNIKMGDLAGDNLNYLKRTIALAGAHYPERAYKIFIVNAPFFFSLLWKMVRPMVHENTQKKIHILTKSETLKGLMEEIPIEDIPEYYGGKSDYGGHDSCRFYGPEAVAINEFVRRINEGIGNKIEVRPFPVAGGQSITLCCHDGQNNNPFQATNATESNAASPSPLPPGTPHTADTVRTDNNNFRTQMHKVSSTSLGTANLDGKMSGSGSEKQHGVGVAMMVAKQSSFSNGLNTPDGMGRRVPQLNLPTMNESPMHREQSDFAHGPPDDWSMSSITTAAASSATSKGTSKGMSIFRRR